MMMMMMMMMVMMMLREGERIAITCSATTQINIIRNIKTDDSLCDAAEILSMKIIIIIIRNVQADDCFFHDGWGYCGVG